MDKYSVIDINSFIKKKINYYNYTESVLELSIKYGILQKEDLQKILLKFISLLFYKIDSYTNNLTSSISVYKAREINSSNLWIIGLYLKKYSIFDGINILLNCDILDIYNKSYKELNNLISKTRLFYETVFKTNILNTTNYFYNATLKDGVSGFFKLYDKLYGANNTIITADYEPFLKRPKLSGVWFIYEYLKIINYENIFCNKFDNKKIEDLLKASHKDYKNLPINIFEIVFQTVIILEYQNEDIYSLNIHKIDIKKLYDFYDLYNELYAYGIKEAYERITDKLNINENMRTYLDKCFKEILKKILFYTSNNILNKLFMVQYNYKS